MFHGSSLPTAILVLFCFAPALAAGPPLEDLRLNDIQVIGSHNSYKRAMPAERMSELAQADPDLARALDYAHVPIVEQLDLGLRALELDVFYDPEGDLFSRHETTDGRVSRFAVLHVQNLDDRSHCPNLLECLTLLRRWSEAHPDHLPVFLSFNAKDVAIDRPGFVTPRPFTEEAWQAFDAEIRDVLGDRLITPDDVFEGRTLAWPILDSARGRFLLVLDEVGDKRQAYAGGEGDSGRWRTRAMFATLPPDAAGAAMMILNDPVAELTRIQDLVRDGFIVRTRADADTVEARAGTVERREAAFASGAHIISTDYYLPDEDLGTGYQVVMPGGGAARCNPVRVRIPCSLESVAPADIPAAR